MASKPCKDCEPGSKRPAPYPGPRCFSHSKAFKKASSARSHARASEVKYGLNGDRYAELYAYQGGSCAICQRARGLSKRLCVDHDHESLAVRGLLCNTCNRIVIGRYDVEALQRAINYLNDPPAQRLFGLVVPSESGD